jgi:hypothetical protein
MKKLTATLIIACGLVAGSLHQADAAAVMRLSADGGVTWTNVVDNGPLDKDLTPGFITYSGPVGNWVVVIASGLAAPPSNTPLTPAMDLSTLDFSLDPETLIVQMSDTDFIPFPNETFVASLTTTTDGTLTYNTYRDTGNVLFGTTANSPTAAQLTTEGPFTGGTFTSSKSVVIANGGTAPYSLTLETTVVHTGAGQTTSDASLFALPQPPCDCALTFNSPASINICEGEAIPAIVASQTCAGVLTSAPVTVTGTVTNGACPQFTITRTNIAVSGCSVTNTFVQTITVNCPVDCTLTLSAAKVLVGSNYTASVADAGPGATYDWSIDNGTIQPHGNTTTITWTAGTDTSNPVTIFVTVTTAAGCKTVCNQGVPFSPPPPTNLGSGDTATIGFWHNKNGQGLILNAPNSPALGNWLGMNFSCLFGSLKGKNNSVVAAAFLTDFGVKGQKTYAQILAGAFAIYFTSSDLAGSGAGKFGFNITPGGTGAKSYNVGALGTVIGLQNNQSYTIMQLLKQANADCPLTAAQFDAFNTIFSDINQKGDIN